MDERRIDKQEILDIAPAFCSVLILVFLNGLFKNFARDIFENGDINALITDILSSMISLGCPILVLHFFTKKREKFSVCSTLSFRELLKCLIFVLGIGYLFRISYAYFVSFLSFIQPSDIESKGFLILSLYFVSSVVLPSVLEEILFRKQIFLFFEGYRASILVTSVLFAISHSGLHSIINAFIFGVLLQQVYYHKRHLGYCIIIHFTNNTIAFFNAIAQNGSLLQQITVIIPYAFAICFIISAISDLIGRKKKHEQ